MREAGLPLTVNLVVHRQNLDHLEAMLAMAVELGAQRVEVAHVQYYGWALKNRAALMPTRDQLDRATATVEAARARLKGIITIDYVVPDYYARRPKACMGGWGRQFINISPAGLALPCHAAESIAGLAFDSVRRAQPCRHLAAFGGLRAVPRHRLDAGTVPFLRAARARLGRLPLPGLRAGRRRGRHRSGLRPVAAS